MDKHKEFRPSQEAEQLLRASAAIPEEAIASNLRIVEAGLSLLEVLDEVIEVSEQIADPSWQPEVATPRDDSLHNLLEAQKGEHDAKYIALGELLMDEDISKTVDAVFSPSRKIRDRTVRQARQTVNVVANIDKEPVIGAQEVSSAALADKQAFDEVKLAVDQVSETISIDKIIDIVTAAENLKGMTLSRQDAALLLGKSFKQAINFFSRPEVVEALNADDKTPITQQALEYATLAFEHSIKGETEKIRDTAARISVHLVPKTLLNRHKNKRTAMFCDIVDELSIPNTILSAYKADNNSADSIAEIIGYSAHDFMNTSRQKVVDDLNVLIEGVGDFVAENPSPEAMLEAIAVDEYKQTVLKRLRDHRSVHDHQDRSQYGKLKPLKDVAELADFNLARALTETQTVEVDYTPEQLAEYQTLLDQLHASYALSNKELRALDPGLSFTNLLRNGFKSPTGEQLITPQGPVLAKELSVMLLALNGRYQRDGEATFDTWLEDLQAEPALLQILQQSSAHLNEDSTWLAQHLEALQKVGARNLPAGLYDMLTDLTSYLDRLDGKLQPPSIIQPIVEVIEVVETESEPEPEPEVLDMHENLFGTAESLDFEIFPPGMTFEEIQTDVVRHLEREELKHIDWDRLRLMVELRDSFIGHDDIRVNLYRSRPGSLATRIPYYALEFKHQRETIMVADNPQHGNATYVVREDRELGTWQEILQLPKAQVRELGGQRMFHADGRLNNPQAYSRHRQKIIDAIIMNLTVRTGA
jgi:hypothetical protein